MAKNTFTPPPPAFTMRDVDAARQFLHSRTIHYRGGDTSAQSAATAGNLNAIAAVRFANAVAAAEAATGGAAIITEAWRSDATQAVYRANREGRPVSYNGVTYPPDTYVTEDGKTVTRKTSYPTARPGNSNHREGGAIDLSVHGESGAVRSWMRRHAPSFGLRTIRGDDPHLEVNEATPLTDEESAYVVQSMGYASVEDFQAKNGLTADGVVGPQTTKAMLAEVSKPSVAAALDPANKPYTIYSSDIRKAEEEGTLAANPPLPVDAVLAAMPDDPFGVTQARRDRLQTQPPQTAQSAIADLVDPGGSVAASPSAVDVAMGFVPGDEPTVAGSSVDEVLAGGNAPPAPRLRDQAVLDQQRADMLDEMLFGAGPHRGEFARGRPEGRWQAGAGGAPDENAVPDPTISPLNPAVGGPADRRPTPPVPTLRPDGRWMSGAGGAPDVDSVLDPPSNPRRDPYGFPIDVNRPRLNNGDGTFSTEQTITFDASEVGLPSEIVTIPTIINGQKVSDQTAMAAFARGLNEPVQRGFDSFEQADKAAIARTDSIARARATTWENRFPQVYGEQPQRVYADALDRFDTEAPAVMPGTAPASRLPADGLASEPGKMTETERARIYANLEQFRREDAAGPPSGANLQDARTKDDFVPPPPNPYDDWTRQYDTPGNVTMANEGMGVFEGTPAAPTPEPDMVIGNINYSGPEMATTRAAPTQGAVMEPDPGLGPYGNMAVMDPLAAGARMEDVVGPSPTDQIISEALLSSAGQIGGLPDLNVSGGAAWGETYEQDPTLLTDIGLFDTRPTPGRSPATLSLDAMREFSLPATATSEPDVFDQIIQSEIGPVSSAAPPSVDAVIGPYAMQRAGGSADLIRSLTADAYANGSIVPPEPPSTVSLVGGGPRELASDIGSYNSGLWATAPADDIISRAEGWLQRESPTPDYASIPQGDADWSPSMANAAAIEPEPTVPTADDLIGIPGLTIWDDVPVADPNAPAGFGPADAALVATPAPVEYAQPQVTTVDQVIAQPAAGGVAAGGQAAPRRGGLASLFGGGGGGGVTTWQRSGTMPGGGQWRTGTVQGGGNPGAPTGVNQWSQSDGSGTVTVYQDPWSGTYGQPVYG